MSAKLAIIGECMLELTQPTPALRGRTLPMSMSYGGDTLNTAIYLARLGITADYITALGDDSLSSWMIDQWRGEGVGCGLIVRLPGGVPGLYLVQTDEHGQRSFLYWRENSPARRLLDDPVKVEGLMAALKNHRWLYLSGITLALFEEAARARLYALIEAHRQAGGQVIFDNNYRPRLWPDPATARRAFETVYRLTDIALPSIDDERLLFETASPDSIISRLESLGIGEIALKMAERGCLVVAGSRRQQLPASEVTVIDATAAGDSFNAAYLHARLAGKGPAEAAVAGQRLAAAVIRHRGAIIPAAAMPKLR